MGEGFTTFDHTGDLGLEVWAARGERLFEVAALGLMAQIAEPLGDRPLPEATLHADVVLHSGDGRAMLVDWLNAVLLESELSHAIWTAASVESIEDGRLRARLDGVPRDRSHFTFLREVKAVSHHDAALILEPDRCRCRVVLDI